MLEPYWGEFLTSPVPLELSLNRCSHSCAFCFANHGKPERRVDIGAVLRLLADYPRRKTLTAHLLREGYPVCLSNKTDPFAKSNYRQTLAILRVMAALGIPVQFQTRGGHGIEDALEFLAPAVWYVSIGTTDEELAKRLEPGAPPVSGRFALIRRLRERGHRIVLGFNPCVPEWSPEPRAILEPVREAGAEGAWIEPLHFNSVQEANLLPRERGVLGETLIRRARRRVRAAQDYEHVMRVREEALAVGLEVFTGGQPNRSEFWRPFREVYPKTFLTHQDWVNALHDGERGGSLVTFEEYRDFFVPRLPTGIRMDGSKYIMTSASNHVWNDCRMRAGMRYDEVLWWLWVEPRIKCGPVNMPCFAWAAEGEGEDAAVLRDSAGMPVMVFVPGGPEADAGGEAGAGRIGGQEAARHLAERPHQDDTKAGACYGGVVGKAVSEGVETATGARLRATA